MQCLSENDSSTWSERPFPRSTARDGDHRTPFQRDKARVMHSAAFRRLQAKTQVLGVGMSDFYRTRLTHSLEAAQIGSGIASQLALKYPDVARCVQLDTHLIEALCLAHDIGHPPFGHGGEAALYQKTRQFGGFEGNAQTFRIVTKLEPYTAEHGMNLSRRTLLGLIKYPGFVCELDAQFRHTAKAPADRQVTHPPKGLYKCDEEWFSWVISPFTASDKAQFLTQDESSGHAKTRYKSFDCSIMELADDIAYAIHDLEDAIVMHLVNAEDFLDEVTAPIEHLRITSLSSEMPALTKKLFGRHHHERKNAIGALVNQFITAIEIKLQEQFTHPLLTFQAALPDDYFSALKLFKQFVFEHVIRHSTIQRHEFRGQHIIAQLYDVLSGEPLRLLPENTRHRWQQVQDVSAKQRVITDYLAGMTDEYASRLYATLFMPRSTATL